MRAAELQVAADMDSEDGGGANVTLDRIFGEDGEFVLTSNAPQQPPERVGVPPKQLEELMPAAVLMPSEPEVGTTCSICIADLEAGESVRRMSNCKHCYHDKCIDRWCAAQSHDRTGAPASQFICTPRPARHRFHATDVGAHGACCCGAGLRSRSSAPTARRPCASRRRRRRQPSPRSTPSTMPSRGR